MAAEDLTTYREMTEYVGKIKKEVLGEVRKIDHKVEVLDNNFTQLNNIVLPLTIAMNQTADNTKEMSTSLKEFTKNQMVANGIFTEKMHNQDLAISDMRNITNGITDKKKYNASVVVAIVGLVGLFVSGLFGLAPLLFN